MTSESNVPKDLAGLSRQLLIKRLEEALLERDTYKKASQTDELTGLGNRRRLLADLTTLASHHHDTIITFMLFDIDHFGDVNKCSEGQVLGDKVLVEFAKTLQSSVRPFDRLYRLGGDEFVLLGTPRWNKEDISTQRLAESAQERAEILCLAISEHDWEENKLPAVTISVGVTADRASVPFDNIYTRASRKLRHAKKGGRNRAEVETGIFKRLAQS